MQRIGGLYTPYTKTFNKISHNIDTIYLSMFKRWSSSIQGNLVINHAIQHYTSFGPQLQVH
jgi:hypothetical protein